jgi:DNA invertase Pin-like site-specific DNA recombinase
LTLSQPSHFQAWDVSIIALNGLRYDLSTAHRKMITSVFASLAEFEMGLIQERIKSGIAAAKAKGRIIGRQKVCTSNQKNWLKKL